MPLGLHSRGDDGSCSLSQFGFMSDTESVEAVDVTDLDGFFKLAMEEVTDGGGHDMGSGLGRDSR